MPWNFSPHPAVPGRFVNPFATWLTGVLLVLTATLPLHTRAAQPPAAERSQDNTDRDRKAERRAERQRQLASQPLLDSVIPVAQLKKDFQLFRSIMEQAHGGLYLHTPKEEFDRLFETTERSLTKPLKVREFNMLLSPLVDKIHCGHTSITISDKQLDHFMKSGQLFPIPIIFLGQKPYADHDSVKLPLGAEILTVNGISMDEIVKKLLALAPADGLGTAMKYRTLPIDFDLAYALAYGEPKEFTISYLSFQAREPLVKTLPAIPGKRTVALYDSRHSAKRKAKKFRYQSVDENTGLLTVNTFEFGIKKKSKQKYKDFLQETFAALGGESGKKNLIIDVRENEGGYPKNEMLLTSYLAATPFREMKNARVTTLSIPAKEHLDRKEFPQGIIRYVEKHLVSDFEKTAAGTYQIKEEKNPVRKPRSSAFKGNLYVLISGMTHSGASSLCSLLREYPNVTFLGEETGGCSAAFTAGNLLVYNLPHSWCQLVVPVIRYETNLIDSKYPAHRGIIPDHPVEQTQEDLLDGTDSILQLTLELIQKLSISPKQPSK
jgi:hypothetical protein